MSLVPTTLPRGGGLDGLSPLGIRKDTAVGYSTLLMQRRKDLYPPVIPGSAFPYDPADWAPERWDTWTPASWRYVPFNGGPRICVGQGFAMVEMGYTIVRILQRFERCETFGERGPMGEDLEMVLKAEIVLQPGAGVRVGFWEGEKKEAVREGTQAWDAR
jgi:hypothetical protein